MSRDIRADAYALAGWLESTREGLTFDEVKSAMRMTPWFELYASDAPIFMHFIRAVGEKPQTDPLWAAFHGSMALSDAMSLALYALPAKSAPSIGMNVHHRNWFAQIQWLDASGAPETIGVGQSNRHAHYALVAAILRAAVHEISA